MKKIFLLLCLLIVVSSGYAQKKKKTAEPFPSTMEVFIDFDKGSSYYTKSGLNTLDSIYMIAFNKDNDRFYKMTITGYDDAEPVNEANTSLARQRAVMVFKYFASREETEYIIKRTPSKCFSSCEGEKTYYIKYKMPFDFRWINLYDNDAWKDDIKNVNPAGKVHIVLEEDPESCVGEFYDYDYPANDTVMSGSAAKVKVPKGCISYIHHTKDTVIRDFKIDYREVMSFEDLTDKYFLIPHKKQYILNAGYIIISPSFKDDYLNCANQDTIGRHIDVSLYLEEQQRSSNLKFYGKTYKPNGEVVYKSLKTKKRKVKETGEMWLDCQIELNQLDTIFVGKKIEEKEMSDYFYSCSSEDRGAFEAMGGWLRCYKMDKKGQMILKDKMKGILRTPKQY